jgi:transcriptional regulator with XRE-family HTH domain
VYPNLKLQLWRSGIRQNRLAQMLGMDETMLSKIINGYRSASPELRGRIAVALQSNEEWLFESTALMKSDLQGPARA